MPITLITGPANAGKAQVAMDAVRRHLAHGQEPLLVVPTRADAEHYLRELAGEHAALGVRVERFQGLIGEAARRAGIGETALGAVARTRVIEALVAGAGVDAGAGVRADAGGRAGGGGRAGAGVGAGATPGFVRALGELFAELRVRRVQPARLRHALSAALPDYGHAHLGELFAGYCAALERLGRMDREQRAVRALDALRERPALWGATPVIVYGFDDLTPLQLDAIETLGRVVDAPVSVSLTYEPGRVAFVGRAASYHALAPLASEHRALPARAEHYAPSARAALSHLERSLFEPADAGAPPAQAGGALTLLEGGGERAELELVAREIAALIEQGMPAREIAVLVRAGGTDLDLLEEVLRAHGVPFALTRRRRFSDTAIGQALIGLLRCVPALCPPDGSRGELADLLAWLRAPGTPSAAAPDGSGEASAADRLEIAARRAGALSADRARALWEERMWPLDTLARFTDAQARGARALCERAARELDWLFCAPRRASAHVLASDERDEAQALSAGRRALAELRELARSAPELAPRSAAELARSLEALELTGGAHATAAAQEAAAAQAAVAVLDPLALRARRVRAGFVCGLQEGVFPARGAHPPVLGEEERRRLAERAGLSLGEAHDVLAAERYLLYAAVSRPQERLFLSWHTADDDGQASPRSLFVDDVCDLFAPSLVAGTLRRALGSVAAIDAGHAQPADVRAPAAVARGQARPEAPRWRGPAPARRLRDERVLAQLRARPWSASSLERWIGCPVSWFVERLLSPDAFEPDPEPLARGGLAHAALRDTLEGLRRATGSARVSAATLTQARELLRDALAANEAAYPLSVAPERRVTVRRRLRSDLERYLQHAADCESPLEPQALELAFGFAADDERGEGSELPAFDLGDGVTLRGRVDRVDVGAGGEAAVYDYKGGRAPAGARWLSDGDLQVALYMCAVEQLLNVQAVGGFYQPLTGEDLRARGVLDGDAGQGLACVSTDVREHADVRELLAHVLAAARAAAGEARRGELQARPQTCAFRGGCMYPSICRCER
ncbi:MAG TPA: PD-(D/E)XK nuclease family protein [Solirubrobacteraceae bacterium]|nr:PD-(D/E)XK nuclease family protein [Solirubrobacteraceae bacterium]